MALTGYFHTESSHHASEYWSWFRKNPDLVKQNLPRRWDYYEICSAHSPDHNVDEFVETSRRRRPGALARIWRLHHRLHDDRYAPGYLRERPQSRAGFQPPGRLLRRGGVPGGRPRPAAGPVR